MMLTMNPVLADAMKRAGEKLPENGVIAMSNGTPIACALSWPTTFKFQNAKQAKEFRDKLGNSEFLSGTWDGKETVKVKAANDTQLRKAREIAQKIDPGSVKASVEASIACASPTLVGVAFQIKVVRDKVEMEAANFSDADKKKIERAVALMDKAIGVLG